MEKTENIILTSLNKYSCKKKKKRIMAVVFIRFWMWHFKPREKSSVILIEMLHRPAAVQPINPSPHSGAAPVPNQPLPQPNAPVSQPQPMVSVTALILSWTLVSRDALNSSTVQKLWKKYLILTKHAFIRSKYTVEFLWTIAIQKNLF